jgi:hypothetical protein
LKPLIAAPLIRQLTVDLVLFAVVSGVLHTQTCSKAAYLTNLKLFRMDILP